MKNINTKNQAGFTLVEVIIAMAIFSVVSMMFMGIFTMVSNIGMRVESQRIAQQDTRFSIEQVAREFRSGWDFALEGVNGISYETESGRCKMFVEEDEKEKKLIIEPKDGIGNCVPADLTSSGVQVEDVKFEIIGNEDKYQSIDFMMRVKRKDEPGIKKSMMQELTVKTRTTSRMREVERWCQEKREKDSAANCAFDQYSEKRE